MIGKVVGGDREFLCVVKHLLRIDVFRGGDDGQRRVSGGESEPSYQTTCEPMPPVGELKIGLPCPFA